MAVLAGDQLGEIIALLNDVAVELHKGAARSEVEGDIEIFDSLATFSRARELVRSSAGLIGEGLAGAAFILQRPLFEDALILAEIAGRQPDERLQLTLELRRQSLNKMDGMARLVRRHGDLAAAKQTMDFIEDQRRGIARKREVRGVSAGSAPTWETLADRHGRRRDWVGYNMSTQAVHGNELVHMLARQRNADGTFELGKPSPTLAAFAGTMAIGSGLQIMRGALDIFGRPLADNFESLATRLDAIHDGADSS